MSKLQTAEGSSVHVIAVDDEIASELAWNELLKIVPQQDKIIVVHGEQNPSELSTPSAPVKDLKQENNLNKAEEILQKYKAKCSEGGRSCEFMKTAYAGPVALATQITQKASDAGADDIWMGGHDRGEEISKSSRLVRSSLSANVTGMAPCSVHVIKSDLDRQYYSTRSRVSNKPHLPGFFDAIADKVIKK